MPSAACLSSSTPPASLYRLASMTHRPPSTKSSLTVTASTPSSFDDSDPRLYFHGLEELPRQVLELCWCHGEQVGTAVESGDGVDAFGELVLRQKGFEVRPLRSVRLRGYKGAAGPRQGCDSRSSVRLLIRDAAGIEGGGRDATDVRSTTRIGQIPNLSRLRGCGETSALSLLRQEIGSRSVSRKWRTPPDRR